MMICVMAASESRAQSTELHESFQEHVALRARAAEEASETMVAGLDGWLFLTAELRHMGLGEFWGEAAAEVSRAKKVGRADPLPVIIDFHQQLQKSGVELWLVPVPPKVTIYPEMLSEDFEGLTPHTTRRDPSHQKFYRLLGEAGIRVVDLTADFLAAKQESTMPIYCRTDSHWSGPAMTVAAELLAMKIKEREWHAGIPKRSITAEEKEISFTGDLASDEAGKETVLLRDVGMGESGHLKAIDPSEESPVLLLGDSHNLVFHSGNDMHSRGAGLPDQLAYELGYPVDLIAVRGSGATPSRVNLLRKVRRDPVYLSSKKVVIWCFAAREFTESDGWAKVPVVKDVN